MAGSKEYLTEIQSLSSIEQIAHKTISFLKSQNTQADRGLINVDYFSTKKRDDETKIAGWIKEIVANNDIWFLEKENYAFCKLNDKDNFVYYVLYSDFSPDFEILRLCETISKYYTTITETISAEINNNYANLVSQLLHDVSSLITMMKKR